MYVCVHVNLNLYTGWYSNRNNNNAIRKIQNNNIDDKLKCTFFPFSNACVLYIFWKKKYINIYIVEPSQNIVSEHRIVHKEKKTYAIQFGANGFFSLSLVCRILQKIRYIDFLCCAINIFHWKIVFISFLLLNTHVLISNFSRTKNWRKSYYYFRNIY